MNYSESPALTNFIITALKKGHRPVIDGTYGMTLCGIKLWCANYPYAYGMLYCRPSYGRPSRAAIKMLHDAELLAFELAEYLDKNKQCE